MKVNDRNSISLDATPLGVNGPDLEITDDREAVVTQPDNNILFGIQNNKEKNPLLADEAVISPSTANKYVSNGTSLDEKKCVELFSDEHHAEWRKGFEKREGVGARRLKPLRDGTLFNINVPFSQLHPERQAESKAAGNSAMKALSMYVSCYDWNEKMAQEYLHINYIKRNKKMFEKVNLVIAEKLPKWAKDNNEGSLRIMREIQSQNLLCTKAAASEFHETWREEFKLKNGNVPRMKDNPDGTQIDINKPFDQLNMHWQRENLLAAHAARVGCILFPEHSGPDADEMVYHYYHEQWRERNAKTSDNEKCHVPYGELLKNDALKNEAIKVTKQVKRMRCMITLWDPRVYKCAKALHEKFRATSSGNCIALKANRDGSVENVNVEFDELHLDQKKDYLVQMHIALRVCKTRLISNSKPILLKEIYDKEYCIEYGRTNEEYRVKVDSSDISIGTKMYKDLTKAEKAHVRDMITIALDEVKVDPAIGIYSSRSRVKDFTREMSLKKLLRQEALIKAVWTPSVAYKFEKILAEEDEKANDSDLCFEDPFNNNGMTLFHYAVRSGNRDVIDYLMGRVDQLILENPSKDSFTPLIWASYLNDDITVTSLLEKKVNVDAADKDGWTALMWATCMGHIKVVEILLKNKAYVLASETHNGWTALTLACRIHYWKILQHLLDNLKLPGDKKLSDLIDFDGWNLLHHTVAMKRLPNQTDQETTSCLFKLLSNDRKFDVNAPTCRLSTEEVDLELTPMHIAASNGLFKHVQLLAYVSTPKKGDNKYGIEALCKLVTKRSQKVKPIYLAAIYDDYDEVVKFLLKREAAEYAKKQSADNWKSTLLRLFDDIHRVITSKDVTDIQEAAFRDHMKVVNAFLHYPAVMETGFRKETLIQYLYKHAMRFWESMSIWIDDKYKGTNDYKIWIENFRFEDNTLLEAYDFEVHFKHKYLTMIESIRAREAESMFKFIDTYDVKKSEFVMVDPFVPNESDKFLSKWIMVKDEYITVGDSNKITPCFWAKRAHKFPYEWFNRNIKGANHAVDTECVSYTIDIPFSSHRSFLKLFLLIDEEANTEKSDQHNIFDIEFVKVSVLHAWKSYGIYTHIGDLILFILFLVLSSYTNYTFKQLNATATPSFGPTVSPAADDIANNPISAYDTNSTRPAITLVLIELIIACYFTVRWLATRLVKLYTFFNRKDKHLFRYFGISDFSIFREIAWLAWYSLTIYGDIVRLRHRAETDRSSYVIAVATMLQYMLLILFFRPFSVFGPLIGMIEAILWDIKWYILILTVVVYGFSQAIYLSSWSESVAGAFDGPGDAMAQALVFLIGNPVFPPIGTYGEDARVAEFLAIMLTVTGSIILLNLLIAIMNSSYMRIYARSEAEWVKQICVTITEQIPNNVMLLHMGGDKFIHYLRRKVDIEKETEESKATVKDAYGATQKIIEGFKILAEESFKDDNKKKEALKKIDGLKSRLKKY